MTFIVLFSYDNECGRVENITENIVDDSIYLQLTEIVKFISRKYI